MRGGGEKVVDASAGVGVSVGSAWGNVGYLERVPGNPQCGDLLAPGETKQMTWVSLMP